jgi:hypothetical protein
MKPSRWSYGMIDMAVSDAWLFFAESARQGRRFLVFE